MLDLKRLLAAAPREHEPEPMQQLSTPWGEGSTSPIPLPQHPRPQFARSSYLMLHGSWEYAMSDQCQTLAITRHSDVPAAFDGDITVPFSPEAPLSGVGRQLQPHQLLWYRLRFTVECTPHAGRLISSHDGMLLVKKGQRCLLHFDGVDHECVVWLNGTRIAHHRGAYLPFSADIADELVFGENELVVCATDPSDSGSQLRGKQKLRRGDIWYTAQSGIWQPVWLEAVPAARIESLQVHADMHGNLTVDAITSKPAPTMKMALFLRRGPQDANTTPLSGGGTAPIGDSAIASANSPVCCEGHDADPVPPSCFGDVGIVRVGGCISEDDPCRQVASLSVKDARLWSPEEPNLYAIEIRCGDDKVQTYCAFRSVEVKPDAQGVPRFHLNGKPYFLRGVLDQGYWPDGLMTPPSDEALVHDISAMKELGFNMLRKHIKVENERWYWHCDRLGMLVWQDMPSGGTDYSTWYISHQPTLFRDTWTRQPDDTPEGQTRLSSASSALQEEWTETCRNAIERLRNHPCVVTWVLFNEGWGQFNARQATQLVRALDPTRPIDATSGWYDQGCGDFWSVHNYFRPLVVWPDPQRTGKGIAGLWRRQETGVSNAAKQNAEELNAADGSFQLEQPAATPSAAVRVSTKPSRAFVISEFGGLSWHVPEHSALARSYGYASFTTLAEWRDAVLDVLAHADALERQGLAGFVYTQLSDVEEETNGLLTYDRRVNKLGN